MKNKNRYLIKYTLVFVICCLGVFYRFYSQGKTFIVAGYIGDGWEQHYKAYIYYSRYLKSIVYNLIRNHALIIPQWDFSIGEGADILGTFHYYVIGDPIAFLSIFIPERFLYVFYDCAVVLRLYLAGLAFSSLCFYFKKNKTNYVLAGSAAYVFCFWTFVNSARHIYFLNPMIFFPLVILGIEKIINNDESKTLTISVLLSCLSNFYFFYDIVLLTAIYVSVRLIILYGRNYKKTIEKLLRITKYSLLGTLMGSVILFPIIYVFIVDSRMSITFGKHLLYPLYYYFKMPSTFFSTRKDFWMCMGFASPVLCGVLITLIKPKRNKLLFALNLIAFIMSVFPLFGQILNGFSYISNKWCFALSLLVSYNLVVQWDEFDKNIKPLVACYFLLSAICLLIDFSLNVIISLFICLLFIILNCIDFKTINKYKEHISIFLIILNVSYVANSYYSYYSELLVTSKESLEIFSSSEAYEIKSNSLNEEFFRYSGNDLTYNANIIFSTNSTDYYWSLTNPNVSKYRTVMDLNEYSLYGYKEYGGRTPLYSLANVKYYITKKYESNQIPYGFTYCKSLENYDLYENNYYLPFGYTYSNVLSYDEWSKLSAVEKQEALLQNIVLNNITTDDSFSKNTNELDYQIICEEGITIDNNVIKVSDNGAKMCVVYKSGNEGQLYLSFAGLNYDDGKNWLDNKNTSITINASLDDVTKAIEYKTNDDKYYNGRDSFVVLLGDSSEVSDEIEISFSNTGDYYFEQMKLYEEDTQNFQEYVLKLSEESLKNIVFGINELSGEISVKEDKYLLLSIPYSKGWKAFVDGREEEVLNANVAYMAIHLNPGTHKIELKYETPFLKIGSITSFASLLFFIIDSMKNRRKNNII